MKPLTIFLATLLLFSCNKPSETPLSAEDVVISWSVLENMGGTYACSWSFNNAGSTRLSNSNWTLYFNQAAGVPVPDSQSGPLKVQQLSGTYYSITPTDSFQGLAPGESIHLDYQCYGAAIKESDAPSGLYIIFDGQQPQLVRNFEVEPLINPEQINRSDIDRVPIPWPDVRYLENQKLTLVPMNEVPRIIPAPQQIIARQGSYKIPSDLSIGYQAGLESEAIILQERLAGAGHDASVTGNLEDAQIKLTLSSYPNGVVENYRLTIDGQGISISGSDPSGVFYGAQSLIALWPMGEQEEPMTLDALTIVDGPRFQYRGMHLDVARNFQKPRAIKKLLDLMSFYKLNKFHFHLTDDEGWRLEIRDLPELTTVGGTRGHTKDELDHLYPAYGSGPFSNAAENHGTGFYSRQDFIDILQYANQRHIEIIPEFNFPGHARAAIKAMIARDVHLKAGDTSYLLHDPADSSKYQSVQGYDDNVICPCQESVYQFLEVVIADVVSMYQQAGVNLTTIHTGGDEVPAGIWEGSPACVKLLASNPEISGIAGLPTYFLSRYHEILNQHQLVTAGWEEIAMHKVAPETSEGGTPLSARQVMVPNPEFVNNDFLAYVWLSIWGVAGEDLAYQLANTGYKVVMSNASNLYFDFAYDKDPKEPGFYWAGLVDTRKPFELVPLDVLQTATVDIMGNPLDMDNYQDHVKLTRKGRENILGIQGQLWSETVKGSASLEYYVFPKLLGLAERAWAPDPPWAHHLKKSERMEGLEASWNLFANAIGRRELARMDQLWEGVNYRLPPPGAIIDQGKLKANVAFPGLSIHYSLDGSEPSVSSPKYLAPVDITSSVKLRSFSSTGKGSRTITLEH